ncbi:YwiC-like family protein [Chloroflexus sp.]|uniref:YwiC-like family protein n=1 Tax=Chloroflexus sp. TaxID=1904827 RepID=UPI00404A5551
MTSSPTKSAVRLRLIALPTEHGGWGLLGAPILLGLWVAPSPAGVWLSLAALGAFLTRQPLKVALGDWRRGKRFPRTIWAERFALIYGLIALGAFAAAWFSAARAFWSSLLLAAPFALVQFRFDLLKQSRALIAELCGATAISSLAAVIAQAAGWMLQPALLLWLLPAFQTTTVIVYVGTRLCLARGTSARRAPALLAHLSALAFVGGLVGLGMIGWSVAGAFAILMLRCWIGLLPRSLRTPTPLVGVQELGWSLLIVMGIGLGI